MAAQKPILARLNLLLWTHARTHTHTHTQGSQATLQQSLLRPSRGNFRNYFSNRAKWLSWAASIKQLRNKVNTTARMTTGVLKRTKFLLQSLKVIALQMIKLEEKDIRGQPRSENCSGWIWPATKLRQHLQFSPLENSVMCSTEFFHLWLP